MLLLPQHASATMWSIQAHDTYDSDLFQRVQRRLCIVSQTSLNRMHIGKNRALQDKMQDKIAGRTWAC